MSYARIGPDSDVYIFATSVDGRDVIECCGCRLHPQHEPFLAPTPTVMLAHVDDHRAVGHRVPGYVDQRLHTEITEEQDTTP